MATEYGFVDDGATLDATVLVQENSDWEEENCDQNQTHYSDAVDVTLTEETQENYDENDSGNDSHYFSILDNTSDINLQDIHQSALHSDIEIEPHNSHNDDGTDSTGTIDLGGQQVVLFRIDGSDDLYGLQVAQDEHGNLQRFQFKVRESEEGNLEAVPETIQISPFECDVPQIAAEDNELNKCSEDMDKAAETDILIRSNYPEEEHLLTMKKENEFLSDENDDEYEYQDDIDIKPNVLSQPYISDVGINENINESEEIILEKIPAPVDQNASDEELPEMYDSNFEGNDSPAEKELTSDDNIEHIFVKEDSMLEDHNRYRAVFEESDFSQASQEYEADSDSESDNEEYQIVNGMHITADAENSVVEEVRNVTEEYQSKNEAPMISTRILKVQKQPELQETIQELKIEPNVRKNIITRRILVLKSVEKENMGHNFKAHPRSILKSSQALLKTTLENNIEDEKFEKRFAKSKEAIRAKLFQNYIAQTKIIQAPVRRERLPRKQKIQPVNRTDEEIVVQEVFVPSNGYPESRPEGVLKERIKTIETIQLSDTDEDYDPRRSTRIKRKTKRRKSQIEIIITDSEESQEDEDDIISLSYSDSDIEEIIVDKKRRGRPPKNKKQDDEPTNSDSPTKRGRGRPPKTRKFELEKPESVRDTEVQPYNTRKRCLTEDKSEENKCTKCSKSFPSASSLRTHMQYHNLTESNKRKYKCDQCEKTFINNILLTRHKSTHKDAKTIVCNICKNKFSGKTQLTIHKRTHVKEHMFKSTVVVNVTPSKVVRKLSPVKQFKCTYCGRILLSALLLSSHIKNHARYKCTICQASFISKYILDNHVSKNCVKSKSPHKKINESSKINTKNVLINPKSSRKSCVTTTLKIKKTPQRKTMYNTRRSVHCGLKTSSNIRDFGKRILQTKK